MAHNKYSFAARHIGPSEKETNEMLKYIGVNSLDELIDQTVPEQIRLKNKLKTGTGLSEYEYLKHLKAVGAKNKVFKSYIGQGYYGTITPPVIQRNVLENPGWYTAYTPYQAEIAQGRLEGLLNFQTVVMDLTGMPIANASLLDEATAASEAMTMLYGSRSKEKTAAKANVFVVADDVFPQTIDVVITRANPLGIEVKIVPQADIKFDANVFGVLLQYPNRYGSANDYAAFAEKAKAAGVFIAVATDLLSLALLKAPGEWGADVVVGNSQRFGVPMGYGGPHAAFFACKEDFKRLIPGRIIGVSIDASGKPALRMALQTREQHIRRDKATSNICTAQALLAIMASMYAVYHGHDGIQNIAQTVHNKTVALAKKLTAAGLAVKSQSYFDTIHLTFDKAFVSTLKAKAIAAGINLNYASEADVTISLDETTSTTDLNNLLDVFAAASGKTISKLTDEELTKNESSYAGGVKRNTPYLQHPVFNTYHSESEMMRYIKRLENKDLSLVHSMISLGSCTMKLNAAAELLPITWPEFANIHPFVPFDQAQGYAEIISELNKDLSEITGFAAMSMQPNSGAQGEYAGLMVIRAYHMSRGDMNRTVALIPSSAHGTNPASAALAGMQIVVVKCDEHGNIDVADLKAKAEQHKEKLSCLMVTYPSTHGVFEESIKEITAIIHANGGQVYMDGANMNAQVGLTSPGSIGADVCHLNLHKTFAIPHGGGGPGMGPIGVAAHLVDFLPGHVSVKTGGNKAINAVSAAPYGSSLILLISYGYIKMLGSDGLTNATKYAILNANYMKEKLKSSYSILYTGKNDRCAHEMILDCREFKRTAHVEVADIAKRLMDYGFHAPTVAFPVVDTLMVEPTESEGKAELDRFCEAMINIRKEIDLIAAGKADMVDNVIKNAPHTADEIMADDWKHAYTRSAAAYGASYLKEFKFWPSVSRIDNAHGDRNLVCSCLPIESYVETTVA
ncbi:MAG TPA: aminomethyl-transferring glycine dehydrogenase [Flavobacteriales bacterium]|nr:aminomethyl-transferring glycine dehydrogenase [Flavobacteriales bacterium]